eukprot:gene29630-38753_t
MGSCTSSSAQQSFAPTDIVPNVAVGLTVSCAFGTGKIEEYRPADKIYVIKLFNWKLAQGQSPTLYLNESSFTVEKPLIAVGETVSCAFGTGKIEQYRPDDKIYVVTLFNWQLAQGQSPTLYLNDSSFSVISKSGEVPNPVAEIPSTTVATKGDETPSSGN